jgi:hypothetical protein
MPQLVLRPHHLLDIVMSYGHDQPDEPHRWGADVAGVKAAVVADPTQEATFVLGVDSICKPCGKLDANGHCTAMIPRDPPVPMAEYNDALDARLFETLGMEPGTVMPIDAFLAKVAEDVAGISNLFRGPNVAIDRRIDGTRKGLTRLGIPQRND